MFLAVTIVGFVMMTLGVAMLLLGEVPFLGKRIPALRSRLIGSIFVLFLPLALGVRQASNALFGNDAVQGPVVMSILFVVCMFASFVILFRVLAPKRGQQAAKASTTAKENPLGKMEAIEEVDDVVWLEPEPEPAPKKTAPAQNPAARKPAAKEHDPFDFS